MMHLVSHSEQRRLRTFPIPTKKLCLQQYSNFFYKLILEGLLVYDVSGLHEQYFFFFIFYKITSQFFIFVYAKGISSYYKKQSD